MSRKVVWAIAAAAILAVLLGAFGLGRLTAARRAAPVASGSSDAASVSPQSVSANATQVWAHNLLLRKGPHFRIYVRWIHGQLNRTRKDVNPSFDQPQSFVMEIQKGVISVELKDLADFLNSGTGSGSPLKNISLEASGGSIQMHGTAHKIVPLPVTLTGTLSPLPNGNIQLHVASFKVLKMPMKGLLGMFHVNLADLVPSTGLPGVEIAGNDVRFDTEKLLPPPHIHGQITAVETSPTELKIIYGGAGDNEDQLAEWHNFLRFSGGTLDFGKLSMHPVDLTMIDASQDRWFDLDLVNYQAQMVNGYTRMTADAGLEIYMPDVDEMQSKKLAPGITLDWLKNRNSSIPGDVPIKNGKSVKP